MRYALKSILIAAAFTSSALASDLSVNEARAKFVSGQYDEAVQMATQINSAEALILAAETTSAKVMLGYVDDPIEASQKARHWANQALQTEPGNAEARLHYALAYGFETQSSGPVRAWRKKLPEKTLEAIMVARKAYPEDPRADALLGAWHLGIVRKAGDKRGNRMYGASEADGMKYYELALSKAPDDIVIASNYAAVLLTIDAERHQERVSELLKVVSQSATRNAVEQEVQKRMSGLGGLSDPKELAKKAAELLDG